MSGLAALIEVSGSAPLIEESGLTALIQVSGLAHMLEELHGKKPEFEPKRATGAYAIMAVQALADFVMIVWMLQVSFVLNCRFYLQQCQAYQHTQSR